MARASQVRYYAKRKAYYTVIRGKQYRLASGPNDGPLGPTFTEALRRFKELIELDGAGTAKGSNTVRTLAELYFQHIEGRRATNTIATRKAFVQDFLFTYPTLKCGEIKHLHVYAWVDKHKPDDREKVRRGGWQGGTARMAMDALTIMFAWGVKTGYLTVNPLLGIEKPRGKHRGEEAVISPETHSMILGTVNARTADLLSVLWHTGARTSELIAATADNYRADLHAIVYHADERRAAGTHRHKTAGKGRTRMVFLTGEALAVVERLVKENPTGPLFVRPRGGAWTCGDVNVLCQTIRKKCKLQTFRLYDYRHTYATRFLLAGGNVDVLANLLGNSPNVIRQHYSHLLSDPGSLLGHAEAFRQRRESDDTRPDLTVYPDDDQGERKVS